MRYRIEYAEKGPYDFVNGRPELLRRLRSTSRKIIDIRKVYKSGSTDSVLDRYMCYLDQKNMEGSEQHG